MDDLLDLPELTALRSGRRRIRIPDEIDVPLTDRVQRLIDTAAFRHLASIPQLGLVSLVYPGATHSRFEHSLGVYRNALAFLDQLSQEPRFRERIDLPHHAGRLVVAALLHDVGHWPFCHPIEDLKLEGIPEHESFVRRWLEQEELATLLERDWRMTPDDVLRLLEGPAGSSAERLLRSILSGPIDVDKLDYLYRDSLHAGIPYGRNFDRNRLIGGLCLDRDGERIALDEKAKTAAEMMVFARYVMFSEVYWHHAVRAATVMFQRLFFELRTRGNWQDWFLLDERSFLAELREASQGLDVHRLWQGLFGARRRLYKRLAQYSMFDGGPMYDRLARRPYPWLVRCGRCLATELSRATGVPWSELDVLIDAPPVGLEVEFRVDVRTSRTGDYRPLGQVSPVVDTLATRQFDDFVKRVRIVADPDLAPRVVQHGVDVETLLSRAIESADRETG